MQNLFPSSLTRLCLLLSAVGLSAGSVITLHAQNADTWNGGTGDWSESSLWTNGVPNDPETDVCIDGGQTSVNSVVTLDNSYPSAA